MPYEILEQIGRGASGTIYKVKWNGQFASLRKDKILRDHGADKFQEEVFQFQL